MNIAIPSLVRIKPGALHRVGKYVKDLELKQVALFYGAGVETLFGEDISTSLKATDSVVRHQATLETNHVQAISDFAYGLPRDLDGLVAIGGGRAIDACKYMAHLLQKPLLACPTILSNDGFSSPFSSLNVQGSKRTLPTTLPSAVVVDTDVISKAPNHFYYSGVGDLVSNVTALWDWKQAYHEAGCYVDDFAVSLAKTAVENFIHLPNKSSREPKTMEVLANGLMLSGIAMEVAGSSRPASGSEHLISHAYDLSEASQRSSHGLQVGVACYGVSLLQESTHDDVHEALQASGFLDFMKQHPLCFNSFIEAIEKAPSMKSSFHTLLQGKEQKARLIELCHTHSVLSTMLTQ